MRVILLGTTGPVDWHLAKGQPRIYGARLPEILIISALAVVVIDKHVVSVLLRLNPGHFAQHSPPSFFRVRLVAARAGRPVHLVEQAPDL